MAKVGEFEFPDDLYYHKEHTWARHEGSIAVVGVTDFAQKMAGTVKRVVTLEADDEIEKDKPVGTMSTGKWTGKLYCPVGGEIAEVNEILDTNPSLINKSPYQQGWILKIRLKNPGELQQLMRNNTDAFRAWMDAEIKKTAGKKPA